MMIERGASSSSSTVTIESDDEELPCLTTHYYKPDRSPAPFTAAFTEIEVEPFTTDLRPPSAADVNEIEILNGPADATPTTIIPVE